MHFRSLALGLLVLSSLPAAMAGDLLVPPNAFPVPSPVPAPGGTRLVLELNGAPAGCITSAKGGHATAVVVEVPLGNGTLVRKHLAGVKYEDITITVGDGMSQALHEWLKDTFEHKGVRYDGAIHTADYDGNIKNTLDFFHGLISEIGFPALDASSKDEAKLTIKITPELTRVTKGHGPLKPCPPSDPRKRWLARNFRLAIPGLDTSRVSRIEAFTFKQDIASERQGNGDGTPVLVPGAVHLGDLSFTLPASHDESIQSWFESFVLKGQSQPNAEKAGTLELLDADLKNPLVTLSFHGLGIFKLEEARQTAEAGNNLPLEAASLYVNDASVEVAP